MIDHQTTTTTTTTATNIYIYTYIYTYISITFCNLVNHYTMWSIAKINTISICILLVFRSTNSCCFRASAPCEHFLLVFPNQAIATYVCIYICICFCRCICIYTYIHDIAMYLCSNTVRPTHHPKAYYFCDSQTLLPPSAKERWSPRVVSWSMASTWALTHAGADVKILHLQQPCHHL